MLVGQPVVDQYLIRGNILWLAPTREIRQSDAPFTSAIGSAKRFQAPPLASFQRPQMSFAGSIAPQRVESYLKLTICQFKVLFTPTALNPLPILASVTV